MSRKLRIEAGSGNIFADLGLPDAEELLLKAGIALQLQRLLRAKRLTQAAAAKRIGVRQPDISNILNGRYRGYSVERMLLMLTGLGQDIEISIKPSSRPRKPGKIVLLPQAA